jgi:hypothetical protein
MLSDLTAFRAAQVAAQAAAPAAEPAAAQAAMLGPGFTFAYPEQDDSRHMSALTYGRHPEHAYVRRQTTRRQRRPMSAPKIHVSGCAIHSLTEQTTGVSDMEAPSTKG